VTTMTMTKHDQQLHELTDALRLCLTAVSHRSDELSDDGFTAALDYLAEHVVRVESDSELNLLTLKMTDGTDVDIKVSGEEPL